MRHRSALVALAALAALGSAVLAAGPRRVRLTLRDGTVVEGDLLDRTPARYRVATAGITSEIAEGDVRQVEFLDGSPAPAAGPGEAAVKDLPACTAGFRETRSTRLLSVFGGYGWKHAGPVESLAWSSDGTRLVSGSLDGTIVVRDAATGEPLVTGTDAAPVNAVALAHDGRRALSGNGAGEVSVWDARTGARLRTLGVRDRHARVLAVAISPDGKLGLSGGGAPEGSARLWDLESGELVATLQGNGDRVLDVAFSPDGKKAVTTSYRKIFVTDVTTGARTELGAHEAGARRDGGACSWAFLPSGSRALAANVGVDLRDVETGQVVTTLDAGEPTAPVGRRVAVSPDGKLGASTEAPGSAAITLWDLESGIAIGKLAPPARAECLAFAPDGKRLATGDSEGVVRLWDVATLSLVAAPSGHAGPVLAVASAPLGGAVSFAREGSLRWDARTRRPSGPLAPWQADGPVETVACSPDGRLLAYSFLEEPLGDVKTFYVEIPARPPEHANDGKVVCSCATSGPDVKPPRSLALSAERDLALLSDGHKLETWRFRRPTMTTGEGIEVEGSVGACAVAANGSRALVGDAEGTLRAVDIETGDLLGAIGAHGGAVIALACSLDGRVFSGSDDGTIRIGDLATGKELDRIDLTSSHDRASAFGFSLDGRVLLVGTKRGVVLRFELK